jgi:hypothetical protein
MIRITQQNSAKDAKRYYATADYYTALSQKMLTPSRQLEQGTAEGA